MGYCIRVLGTKLDDVPIEKLRERAKPAVIETDESGSKSWGHLVLKHQEGPEIAVIERNPVVSGELGAEELQEFLDEITSYRPDSAVKWLQGYLPTVKVIYAFQLLSGTEVNDGWNALHRVYGAIWETAGGILQADGEGFSNEGGYTILWQFSDSAKGMWKVAVLVDAAWSTFEIDLGDAAHRAAFCDGQIPADVKLL